MADAVYEARCYGARKAHSRTATVRRIDKYALVPAEADKHCLVNILICCRPSTLHKVETDIIGDCD
jgi:hypothetical protein